MGAEQPHWLSSRGCWQGQFGPAANMTWELLDIAALRCYTNKLKKKKKATNINYNKNKQTKMHLQTPGM